MGKIVQYGIEYGKSYSAGKLITIDGQSAINVNMELSSPEDIEQKSIAHPNTLFFTEGPSTIIHTALLELTTNGWEEGSQSVEISGISANTSIIVTPVSDNTTNFEMYCSCGVRAYSQSSNTLTFKYTSLPTNSLYVNIAYWG